MALYELREEGYAYDEIEADSAEEALEEAESNVDIANYGHVESTIWIDVRVSNRDDDEDEARGTVALHPPAPKCAEGEHDWQSPHELVGGCESNPGVHGHDGGVYIQEVCMHCGCERVTDTWATRRDTGEQGLESVRYEARKYEDEVEALREAAQ